MKKNTPNGVQGQRERDREKQSVNMLGYDCLTVECAPISNKTATPSLFEMLMSLSPTVCDICNATTTLVLTLSALSVFLAMPEVY